MGDAWRPTYLAGADIVQPENYPADPSVAFETVAVLSRFPYDWAPRVTCAMAWAAPITSTAMFRVELYNAMAAGGTGDIWFAHRALPGSWNEPGPLFDQSGVLAKEVMQLVPALLGPEVVRGVAAAGVASVSPQPDLVAVSGVTQGGQSALVHATARRETGGCVHLILINNENTPVRASVTFALGTPGIFSSVGQTTFGLVPFEKSLPQFARNVSVKNGSLSEWLPSWGTQVLRFNGTSDCAAVAAQSTSGNLVVNPSYESSESYVAAPDGWECDISSASQDRMCFADASTAKHGRRSGRFVSGTNFGTLRIAIPLAKSANTSGRFTVSAWVRGDCEGQVVSLKTIAAAQGDSDHLQRWPRWPSEGTREAQVTAVATDSNWTQLHAAVEMEQGMRLAFSVAMPGVIWLDEVSVIRAAPSEQAPGPKLKTDDEHQTADAAAAAAGSTTDDQGDDRFVGSHGAITIGSGLGWSFCTLKIQRH